MDETTKERRTFHGKIDRYDAVHKCWHITYADGDGEERNIDEMAEEMLEAEDLAEPPSTESSGPEVSSLSSPSDSDDAPAAGGVIATATLHGGGPAQEQNHVQNVTISNPSNRNIIFKVTDEEEGAEYYVTNGYTLYRATHAVMWDKDGHIYNETLGGLDFETWQKCSIL